MKLFDTEFIDDGQTIEFPSPCRELVMKFDKGGTLKPGDIPLSPSPCGELVMKPCSLVWIKLMPQCTCFRPLAGIW